MRSQKKWPLLRLAVVLLFTAGAARTMMAYEYVASGPDTDTYEYDPEDSQTSTSIEETSAIPGAQADGDCSCSVSAYAWAKDGDSAIAESEAYGTWRKSWQWNGPPGTAPGGTLSWSHSGRGYAGTFGSINLATGGGLSVANADSHTSGYGSGTGSYGTSNAYGYVDNMTGGDINSEVSGTGTPFDGFWSASGEDYKTNSYDNWILWTEYGDGDDSIASGTSSVYFFGGAWCENYSVAGAALESGEAGANSGADANVSLSASFTSN